MRDRKGLNLRAGEESCLILQRAWERDLHENQDSEGRLPYAGNRPKERQRRVVLATMNEKSSLRTIFLDTDIDSCYTMDKGKVRGARNV